MKNFGTIIDNFDAVTKQYVDDKASAKRIKGIKVDNATLADTAKKVQNAFTYKAHNKAAGTVVPITYDGSKAASLDFSADDFAYDYSSGKDIKIKLVDKDYATTAQVEERYKKPNGGIPKSDLATSVQTSLDKADSALQSAPVTSVNGKTDAVQLGASDVGALPTSTKYVVSVNGESGEVKNIAKTNSANTFTGDQTVTGNGSVSGNFTVGGNLTVNGTTTTVDSTTLQVKDKLIEVAHGNTTTLTTPAGLVAPKYDGTNSGALVFDSTGTAYVGDVTLKDGNIDVANSGLQPLATRTGLVGGNLVQYDSSALTLKDSGKKISDFATSVKVNGNTIAPSGGVVDIGTVLTDASAFATSAQGTKADNAMPKSGGTFTGEVKFGNTENFQGYYIKRMIGGLSAGTAYANLSSSYKDGTWHRMWRLRFPSGSSFWGKIKITLYGGYSSFNASGVMSKSITCNFNTSNIYNNVGCYDGLGVNVEQDFRISEAIWNATVNAWEVLIWQKNLNGNNSPAIMLECWTRNDTNYINAFNSITAQTVELTQSTSYSAQKASPTGGTKTVEWATLPVYENPLGEEIATVAMLEDKQDKITSSNKLAASLVSGLATVATSGSYNDLSNKPTIPTVNNGTLTIQKNGTDVATFTANQSTNVTANITVPTKVSELTNDSGYTTNKGTVTQVKINGTTNSPDSAGLVDLGTVGGSSDNSKFDYTVLTNEDLNTVIEAGRYRAEKGNTCKHRPFILTAPAFFLTVEKTESGSITQTAYLTAGEPSSYYEWYVRYSTNNGSSWYSWRKQQSIDERYSQAFGGTKTFNNIDITNSLEFNGSSGSSSQFAMSQGSSSAPKWVNLQVKVNGTTYTADNSGLIDLGEISGGGGSTSQYNDIY